MPYTSQAGRVDFLCVMELARRCLVFTELEARGKGEVDSDEIYDTAIAHLYLKLAVRPVGQLGH